MTGPERRADGDDARGEAASASDSPPPTRWLSGRAKAIAYVLCVTALAIGGAALVHANPAQHEPADSDE